MKKSIRRGMLAGLAASTAIVLAACGGGVTAGDSASPSGSGDGSGDTAAPAGELSGNLAGAGASAQGKAQEGWMAGFYDAEPGVTVSYDAVGSGGGREQFLAGGTLFAGTDSIFKEDEIASATDRCFGGELIELPLYISPIAVIYNLPDTGVENIQLDAETIAKIFAGEITSWDDAAIADQNPDATLPATSITVVNRSDDSGTTENFTEYLSEAGNGAWTEEPGDAWPIASQQSGDGTSGMVTTVAAAEGAIGYADASQAGDLGTVALKVGEEYVPFSPAAAATAVDASPLTEDATEKRITYALDRTTTAAGAYPLVLISYLAACDTYDNAGDAANVAAYLGYIASEAGQERGSEAAGSAPISSELRTQVEAAIEMISAS
ncbi:phosphate ABC transporter substrate-binding protein PstS [Litorihabitans aurantiacus]|uniref:Phosphate-binding protein n=1 Tax=Litorihabitans aurantiacus TaxID=1930061 RepID=A0AA37XDN3_9MICO|nr:phosphate ABC transporter substrate-binding protein PstS [Litorihabitans aurantiacus]GMA30257.1 phosphate-binding protein PstS [Litorihabitans aurantiacus]